MEDYTSPEGNDDSPLSDRVQFYPRSLRPQRLGAESNLAHGKRRSRGPEGHDRAPRRLPLFRAPSLGACTICSRTSREAIDRRVVLAGPSHFVAFSGRRLEQRGSLRLPAGNVPLDRETLGPPREPRSHHHPRRGPSRREHSLQGHLPFLQICLDSLSLVPLVVGRRHARRGRRGPRGLAWAGPTPSWSSAPDLSDYHDRPHRATPGPMYGPGHRNPRCGSPRVRHGLRLLPPIQGLLLVARQKGLRRAGLLDLRTRAIRSLPAQRSGGGPRALAASHDKPPLRFTPKSVLCCCTPRPHPSSTVSIAGTLSRRGLRAFRPALQAPGASFVTLERHGELRGCIGTLVARKPHPGRGRDAFASAHRDTLFRPGLRRGAP